MLEFHINPPIHLPALLAASVGDQSVRDDVHHGSPICLQCVHSIFTFISVTFGASIVAALELSLWLSIPRYFQLKERFICPH